MDDIESQSLSLLPESLSAIPAYRHAGAIEMTNFLGMTAQLKFNDI